MTFKFRQFYISSTKKYFETKQQNNLKLTISVTWFISGVAYACTQVYITDYMRYYVCLWILCIFIRSNTIIFF